MASYEWPPQGSSGSSGVSSLNTQTGALTLVAGTNITIVPGSGTLTINSTGGGGSGTVTSVSVVTANGLSGTVANPTTTPAITLTGTLTGDITGTLNSNSLTATTNSTLTTLSALSLPGSQVTGNISGDAANVTGTVAIANGGTGQTTVNAAINALLPSQTGNSGDVLTTDGTNTSWIAAGSGANTALSNLTTTSINASLIPAVSGSPNLGSNTKFWGSVNVLQLNSYNNSNTAQVLTGEYATLPDGSNALALIGNYSNVPTNLGLFSANSNFADANATGDVRIESGNKTAGTGNSGNITHQTGTSSGGSRGKIQMKDGSEGTSGQVWTSTDTSGSGSWIAAGAAAAGSLTGTTLASNVVNSSLTSLGSTTAQTALAGGLTVTTNTITANYTIDSTTSDYIIFCNQSAPITITLPVPTNGRQLVLKGISGNMATNIITIAQHASEMIEGVAASFIFSTNYGSIILTSDGTNWWLI